LDRVIPGPCPKRELRSASGLRPRDRWAHISFAAWLLLLRGARPRSCRKANSARHGLMGIRDQYSSAVMESIESLSLEKPIAGWRSPWTARSFGFHVRKPRPG